MEGGGKMCEDPVVGGSLGWSTENEKASSGAGRGGSTWLGRDWITAHRPC